MRKLEKYRKDIIVNIEYISLMVLKLDYYGGNTISIVYWDGRY